MAPPSAPSLSQTIPAPDEPAAPDLAPVQVHVKDPGDETYHVDAKTGAVTVEQADGGAVVYLKGLPKPRKDKSGAFDANLAEDMDPYVLDTIAARLLEGIDADIKSRQGWEETAAKGAEYLGIKLETATADVSPDGSVSKVHHTILLESVTRSWANARAELLPAGGPVKVKDDEPVTDDGGGNAGGGIIPAGGATPDPSAGPVPPLAAGPQPPGVMGKPRRSTLADALEKDMNHYLTVVDKEYYPDFSRMLFSRALLGCQFRKVYRCPLLRRPVSRWVKGTDLIISNDATHLSGAGRVTERVPLRQGVVRRLQMTGHWRDIDLVLPTPDPTSHERAVEAVEGVSASPELPADYLHTIYEVYTEADDGPLEEDENGKVPGFPLPYRITLDKDTRVVLEIRRHWKEGDPDYQPRRRYVKYAFVPGLGFYDLGFIHLIGNSQRAMTAMTRLGIDSEMMASFPGGVAAKGVATRTDTLDLRVGPGQYKVVDTGGKPIREMVMEWPYKGMSPNLLPLMQSVEQNARRLAGTLDVPVGEGRVGNVPVGTIMAYVDAISRVPSAIHKDDHISQAEEFELLRELFAEEPEALWKFAKRPARKWQVAQEITDQELDPAADPNVPSQTHRVMQATGVVELSSTQVGMQTLNPKWVVETALRTIGITPTDETWKPPQSAQPDPKAMAAMMKAKNDADRNQIETQKLAQKGQDTQRQAAADAVEAEEREKDRASELQLEGMRLHIEEMHGQRQHQHDMAALNQGDAHHVQDMLHEHVQGHLERQHEAGMKMADQLHEQTTQGAGQLHEAATQYADQQHDMATQSADQQHEQRQGILGRQHEADMSAAEMDQADVHHQQDLEHEGEQNAAKLSTTEKVAKQRGAGAGIAGRKPKGKK